MAGYPFEAFGTKHLAYIAALGAVWVVVPWLGRNYPDPTLRRRTELFLILFSLGQELVDDLLRAHAGAWTLDDALPLHLCSLAMLVGCWALLSKGQLVFEVAYYWGFAAASQAILTPDNTRWRLGEVDVFWNFLSHGLVILNVVWLIVVVGMRCRPGSWLRVFLITNLALIPIGILNLILDSNYFFICRKPGGTSPFLLGEWPWYLLGFEVLALAFFGILYLPMAFSRRRVDREHPWEQPGAEDGG